MTADMSDMKAILAGVAAGRRLGESEAALVTPYGELVDIGVPR